MDVLAGLLAGLVAKYPTIMVVITIMGICRAVFKPLFTFLRAIADATPTAKDNQLLDDIEQSKIVKGLMFVLDYVASIKLSK